MVEAIRLHKGNRNAIARQYHCSWSTVDRFIAKYKTLRAECDAGVQMRLDRAEEVLDGHIESGDLRAAQFLLSTLGRDRGYSTRSEVDQQLNQTYLIEWGDLPPAGAAADTSPPPLATGGPSRKGGENRRL